MQQGEKIPKNLPWKDVSKKKAQILFNRVKKDMGDTLLQIEKSFTFMHVDLLKRPKRGYAKSSGEK
jgi:hypothetical protein